MHQRIKTFLLTLLIGLTVNVQAAEPLPLEHFFKPALYSNVQLSPDGTHLAAIAPLNEHRNIAVINLETSESRFVTSVDDGEVTGFTWANDDRLLFFMDADGNESFGIFAVNKDGSRGRVLAEPKIGRAFRFTQVLDILEEDPEFILVTNNDRLAAYPDVYRMSIINGSKKRILRNPGNISGWGTDQNGEIRFATSQAGPSTSVMYMPPGSEEWETLISFRFDEPGFQPVNISHDGKTAYVASYLDLEGNARDKAGLYSYDLTERKLTELLFEHPDVDVGGVSISDVTRKPVAATYNADKPGIHYFDEEWGQIQAGIDQALPDTINRPTSTTRDENTAIITAWSSTQPPKYFMYDRKESSLSQLVSSRPWVNPETMAEMKPIKFTARDGLEIPGYLTLPVDRESSRVPLILNPHGGPWARDSYSYNNEIQFLANRGYAVLQVNFRGSAGFGSEFIDAGNREWGLAMQDDLTDAVAWAIDEGIADPDRICIYGASYGGFAAMAGLTFTPELYKCGINYVGVTSIPLLFDTMPAAWEGGLPQMIRRVGDPDEDEDFLQNRSPLNHIENIEVPLFMAYGKRDARVDLSHALKAEKELKRHEKDYELMIKMDEGHGFRKYDNVIDYYQTMETFLSENLLADE
ncbi:MAG: S9 family peptidase [Pseudomonadota bacterium]